MKNNEKLYYCKRCLSLAIVKDGDILYCPKCGCGIIRRNTDEGWEKLMIDKYGKFSVLHPRGTFVDTYFKNEYYK